MAYACAYCPLSERDTIKQRGFDGNKHSHIVVKLIPRDSDSKQLTDKQREMLFKKIVDCNDVGFEVILLSPEELSYGMLRTYTFPLYTHSFLLVISRMMRSVKYNLNAISHDTAKELIARALAKGVPIKEVIYQQVTARFLSLKYHKAES